MAQMALGGAAHVERAVQVHPHQRAPGLVAGVLDQLFRVDAGAMHQMVQPAEMPGGRLEHPFAVVRCRDVQDMGVDALSAGIQLGRHLRQARTVDIREHQSCAVRGHEARGRQPDPVACARDGGNLSFKRNHPVS
ncbi:hypothetical protein D3C71_1648460 [compost metagenome]